MSPDRAKGNHHVLFICEHCGLITTSGNTAGSYRPDGCDHWYVEAKPRKTVDLCQRCWEVAHEGEYAPNTTREGDCAACLDTGLVFRHRIEDNPDWADPRW